MHGEQRLHRAMLTCLDFSGGAGGGGLRHESRQGPATSRAATRREWKLAS